MGESMTRCRFLFAACVGTFFYVIASMTCGRDGIWAERQLLEQKRILSAHTAAIEKTNEELYLEKVALQKDMDLIAAYARKLGYVGEGEKLVKISGLSNRETQIFDAGNVILHEDPRYVPEGFCKGVGLVIFILTYAVLVLYDFSKGYVTVRRPKKSFEEMKGAVAS